MTIQTKSLNSAVDKAAQYLKNMANVETFQQECEREIQKFFRTPTAEDNERRKSLRKAREDALGVNKSINPITGPNTNDSLLHTQEVNDFSLFGMQDEMAVQPAVSLFPVTTVMEEKGHWYAWDRATNNRIYDDDWTEISDGGKSKSVAMKLSDDTYQCREYGINIPLTPRTLANAARTNQNIPEARARFLGQWAVRQRARRIIKLLQNANSFRALSTTTPATKWNSGNWVKDIDAALLEVFKRTGKMPNRAMINREVFNAIKHNPTTLTLINGTSAPQEPALIGPENLAAFIGVDQVVIADGIETTSDPELEGKEDDFTSDFLANDDTFTFFYAPSSLGLLMESAVAMFAMVGMEGYTDIATYTRMFENVENEAEVMEIKLFDQPKIIDKDLGGNLTGVLR